MYEKKELDMSNHRIWKDKNIKPECKRIFAYIYSKGFNVSDFYLNVGDIQQVVGIKNVGLRKNLNTLEDNKYLIFREYDTGMYEISICQIGKTLINNGTVNVWRFMLVPFL